MNMPMEPVFTNPPRRARQVHDDVWAQTIAALIARTGEWALIFKGDYRKGQNLATRIRYGEGIWRDHDWGVTTRKVIGSDPQAIEVYARHLKAHAVPATRAEPPGGAG